MDSYIMGSGESMPRMDGECIKTNLQAIVIQDLGRKIRRTAMENSRL